MLGPLSVASQVREQEAGAGAEAGLGELDPRHSNVRCKSANRWPNPSALLFSRIKKIIQGLVLYVVGRATGCNTSIPYGTWLASLLLHL